MLLRFGAMKENQMTDEQKELFNKLTTLQQEVAKNSIAGMSDIDAYRNSSGKAKSESAQRAGASEILANPNVKDFIDSMKHSAVNDAVMSRQEMLETLTRLARVNLPLNSAGFLDLTQLTTEQREALEQVQISDNGIKAKNYSKLAAMKQLSDIAGYNDPIRVEQTTIQANYDIKSDDPKQASQEYLELIKGV
ncbi:hypothetical protein pA_gene0016 [Vibrio phage 13VT501A]|nr:hypothetical protein pA_gene0016 [Vibrio phage 13VT501A]